MPIVGRQGAFGNLYLSEKIGGEVFTEEEESIAVLLASTIAAVVKNACLREESARLLDHGRGTDGPEALRQFLARPAIRL